MSSIIITIFNFLFIILLELSVEWQLSEFSLQLVKYLHLSEKAKSLA